MDRLHPLLLLFFGWETYKLKRLHADITVQTYHLVDRPAEVTMRTVAYSWVGLVLEEDTDHFISF